MGQESAEKLSTIIVPQKCHFVMCIRLRLGKLAYLTFLDFLLQSPRVQKNHLNLREFCQTEMRFNVPVIICYQDISLRRLSG